jgi:hypothetical protein
MAVAKRQLRRSLLGGPLLDKKLLERRDQAGAVGASLAMNKDRPIRSLQKPGELYHFLAGQLPIR